MRLQLDRVRCWLRAILLSVAWRIASSECGDEQRKIVPRDGTISLRMVGSARVDTARNTLGVA
jgi:hypothetical protein